MLTVYDEQHAVTYVRMLDAEAEGADWREVSRIVLDIDPEREPDRAGVRQRAKWAAHIGYGNCFVEGGPGAIKIGGSPPQIFSAPLRHRWCGTPRSCSGIGLLNVRDVNPYLPSGAV